MWEREEEALLYVPANNLISSGYFARLWLRLPIPLARSPFPLPSFSVFS